MSEDKKDNVVGIGHNNSQYSKEQYAKLMNTTHRVLCYAKGMLSEIEHKFDEAFTKHKNSNTWERKLKDFEIHEKRLRAKNMSNKCYANLNEHVRAIEEKAKARDIKIDSPENEEESNG